MTKKDKARDAGKAKDRPDKARVEALERRLDRLEATLAAAAAGPAAAPVAASPDEPAPGRVRLDLRMGGLAWRQDRSVAQLVSADWTGLVPRLAALGHPLRLAILRVALDGPVTVTGLQAAGLPAAAAAEGPRAAGADRRPSAGQVYHHLRELTATGWLEPHARGSYALPESRRGPLLAAVALAGSD